MRRSFRYVVIAAFLPFVHFADVNALEGVSIARLIAYALCTALAALALTYIIGSVSASPSHPHERTALAVSVLFISFFSFPITQMATQTSGPIPLLVHGAAMLLACWLAWRLGAHEGFRRFWLTTLTLMLLISAGGYALRLFRAEAGSTASDLTVQDTATRSQPQLTSMDRRNVYYLTLDAYPRADVLRKLYGFDNTPFLTALADRGFLVGTHSYANYFATHLSVPATMEQSFIVDESDTDFWNKLPALISIVNGHNRVFNHFREIGYFNAKLNFHEYCDPAAFVDYCYKKTTTINPLIGFGITDLELSLMQLTPLYASLPFVAPQFLKSRIVVKDMDDVLRLTKLVRDRFPRFTYAHILLPHLPYRFNADCTWSNDIDIDGHSPDGMQRFLDQVQCANIKAMQFVDQILRDDPEAIILINSDHGSGFTVDWSIPYTKWPLSAVREHFGNLNAMLLPDRCRSSFYDSISPVNYFELVFSCIEKRTPHFLEDRIYISSFVKSHPQYGRVWRYR